MHNYFFTGDKTVLMVELFGEWKSLENWIAVF